MKIDKSKMTPGEKAYFEELEKKYGMNDPEDGAGTTGGAQAGTEPNGAPAPAGVEKATDNPAAGSQVTGAQPGTEGDDIYKGLHPLVAAELQSLRKANDERETREFAEIAKKYEVLGKKPEEFGPVLKALKASDEKAYNEMIAVMDASVEAIGKANLFGEFGKTGGAGGGLPEAQTELEKVADEIQKSNAGMSRFEAITLAGEQRPELVAAYEKSR